ncbi:PITH domain-containing protein, partial [Delphinella strobiligena]
MSHCHDEHEGHGHDHGHDHDHSHGAQDHSDDITPALQNHIYQQIDFSAIITLNEATPASGAKICQKTWDERLDPEPELCSDADEQLLMHIPFTAQIRLHSLLLRTFPTASAPQTLKIFVNREDLDFESASTLTPTQTISLSQTSEIQDVPVKRALFNTVRSLTLFFQDNWGAWEEDETRIAYLGFKGEWMQLSREPINFLYEAAANPGDHKMVAGVKGGVGSQL